MLSWLRPEEELEAGEVRAGLRMLLCDGLCSQAMGTLTGGAVLVAFAVLLGASNTVIGLLAAVGPLTQLLQIPAIVLVDRTRLRKVLVVCSSFLSRLSWFVVAAIPWLVPPEQRVAVLVVCLFVYFGLGTISGCAFNSWMRDFVPVKVHGSFFGSRLAASTAVGAVLTLLVGLAITFGNRLLPDDRGIYTVVFLVGAVFGLLGVYFLARIPEPKMTAAPSEGLLSVLAEPFREANFRKLLIFLGWWNLAINIAAPFFTVYMLRRLGMSMALVLALSVVSQICNVMFFRMWGRIADRFSNKSVLAVCGWMFILSIGMWPFLTLPEKHVLTLPLLFAIHILAGISTAGVTLCSGNIAMKAAPYGKATAYLAANALVNGAAATIAPILAGVAADWCAAEELSLSLRWTALDPGLTRFEWPAFNIRGLDFLFLLSFLVGQFAIHRLLAVREEGEVEEEIVLTEFYSEVRRAVRHISNVAGLRQLSCFPYALLRGNSDKGREKKEDAGPRRRVA